MRKRLLQKGRYPKSPGFDQLTNPSPHFPQTTLTQCPVTSEVPYYPPVQTQPPQTIWNHPSYPNPSTYQQNQVPLPVSEPSGYWSAEQMQPSDPWNWKVENNTENAYPNYQQQQLVDPPMDIWQQTPQSQVENQNFAPQPVTYNPSTQQASIVQPIQSMNNNCNHSSVDTPLQSWESASLNITQPAQLPWTYSAPQYCNPASDLSTDFSSSTVPSNMPWNYNSLSTSDSEIFNQPPSDFLPCDSNIINGTVNLESSISQNCIIDESKEDKTSNNVPSSESVIVNRDHVIDTECGDSSLSAFFQNSDQNNSNSSECEGKSILDIKEVIDASSLAENLSQLQVNESERSSVPTEDEQNLEDTDDGGNQEVNFIQEDNSNVDTNISQSNNAVGFVEEPVNQEVPEPNIDKSNNSSLQHAQLNQDYHEMSPEEPLNQQIPAESGEKSRSTSAERERVVIRPREESPFKPPRMNSNSKGTVVQQEMII